MTEKPTPITKHRRYARRQKVTAVIAAEMTSVAAAAEQAGIPESTLRYWMDDPEIAELRAKTREDRAEAASTLATVVLGEIKRRLPEFEPRDLSILYGVLTDKGQLLGGEATSRTESLSLTGGLKDKERQKLRDFIDQLPDALEIEA